MLGKKTNIRHIPIADCRHCDDCPPEAVWYGFEVGLRGACFGKVYCTGEEDHTWTWMETTKLKLTKDSQFSSSLLQIKNVECQKIKYSFNFTV